MRRRALVMTCVVPILVLSACGGGDDSEVEVSPIRSTSTPSASASPTAEPLPTTKAEAAMLQKTVLGSSVARTAEEKAVVEAWMTYWQAVSDTYADLEPSPDLDVARGKPQKDVLDYLNELRTKKLRSVGWTRDHVTKVQIVDGSASIADCAENFSFNVDRSDQPVQEPTPFYDLVGSLEQHDGRWIVTAVDSTDLDTDCRS